MNAYTLGQFFRLLLLLTFIILSTAHSHTSHSSHSSHARPLLLSNFLLPRLRARLQDRLKLLRRGKAHTLALDDVLGVLNSTQRRRLGVTLEKEHGALRAALEETLHYGLQVTRGGHFMEVEGQDILPLCLLLQDVAGSLAEWVVSEQLNLSSDGCGRIVIRRVFFLFMGFFFLLFLCFNLLVYRLIRSIVVRYSRPFFDCFFRKCHQISV
mmetsp:Transcript_29954/g.47885  ORF Transcript_29954/g.47885 Transcript_29954/m.47885 type:complete len:211 (-) Transcript_29954:658-1290(-)